MVVGQVHELVDQVRLVKVAGERAELLVGGQAVTAGGGEGESMFGTAESQKTPTVGTSDSPVRGFPQTFSLEHLGIL